MASKGTGRHGLIGGGDKGNGTISQGSRDLTLTLRFMRLLISFRCRMVMVAHKENGAKMRGKTKP